MLEFRQAQQRAIIEIIKAIKAGKTDILVQAPTGTGKSLIALELAKIMHERKGWKSFILTSEKLLQAQYERDCAYKYDNRYSNVVSISGADNYECHINGQQFPQGHCKSMGMSNRQASELPCAGLCDYLRRWNGAKMAPTAILNYSYYLLQMNFVLEKLGERAPFQARQLVICDEAHSLPDVIEGHFACYVDQSLSYRIREVQGLLDREGIVTEFGSINVLHYSRQVDRILKLSPSSLREHMDGLRELLVLLGTIKAKAAKSREDLSKRFKVPLPKDGSDQAYLEASKQAADDIPKSVTELFKATDIIRDYSGKILDYIEIMDEQGLHNMVVEEDRNRRTYHNLSDQKLHLQHFKPFSQVRIYLSATLQPDNLVDRWGLQPETTHTVVLNSGWESVNSPIKLTKTADFRYDNTEAAIKAAIQKIDHILEAHPGERGIIHTTSYRITQAVMEGCQHGGRLIDYQGTQQKMELIEDLGQLAEDAVLVGPSLIQGIDLPDDLARFNVIVKLSYPDVSSRLWKARLQLKKGIYLAETANRLEQSSGRSTRHAEDRSVTYVLDSRAEKFIFSPNTARYLSAEFVQRVLAGE